MVQTDKGFLLGQLIDAFKSLIQGVISPTLKLIVDECCTQVNTPAVIQLMGNKRRNKGVKMKIRNCLRMTLLFPVSC